MPDQHSKATIVSMAVIASALASLLHEGLGHGVTAALRGDVVTQLSSNHLSSVRPDRWVDAAGTIVNLDRWKRLSLRVPGSRRTSEPPLFSLDSRGAESASGSRLFPVLRTLRVWRLVPGYPRAAASGDFARGDDHLWRWFLRFGGEAACNLSSSICSESAGVQLRGAASVPGRRLAQLRCRCIRSAGDKAAARFHDPGSLWRLVRFAVGG
jgi:hypothetical protein